VSHFQAAKPGTTLAGYTVMAEIGRGAASVIYLVQDPKTKHIWALKRVEKNDAKDQRFIDQALSEAEIAQKVRHPGIRHIERVIKARKRLITLKEVFLLMEYVDGISVEAHPPSTFEQAMDIFQQTAKALHVMHTAGYVHADMKPNNIVVCEDGSVKIIDLGQACAIGTIKERIQGTPEYIAPEQVHRREITPRTDIYNFGATMYWVLTHKHIPTAIPKGDSLVSSLEDSMIERPPPPTEVNRRIPLELSDLIMECIEVNPNDRPESMQDILAVLENVEDEIASMHGESPKPGNEAGSA
jgi:serine/threonine-protein kinase